MKNILSSLNMKNSDLRLIENGTPSLLLMEKAALAIHDNFDYSNKRVGVFCGKGNNAGDGYALALLLNNDNVDVELVLSSLDFSKDGKYYFDKCQEKNIPFYIFNKDINIAKYDVIIDAIFGNGFKGEVKEPYKSMIDKINNSNAYVISVDINSGLSSDNGMGYSIQSDLTMSIGQFKYGHFINSAMDVMKKVINLDIGISPICDDAKLLEDCDVKSFFKERKHDSNKGTYGYSAIMGGSKNYVGAIKLANLSLTSLYAGCGLSKIIAPIELKDYLLPAIMESTFFPLPSKDGNMIYDEKEIDNALSGLSSLGLGMGWGVNKTNQKILTYILKNYQGNLLIDADGLNNLANLDLNILNESKAKIVLTPHLKELSRLTNYDIPYIKENLIDFIKEFVNKYKVTLLVKGSTTVIANKEKIYFVNKGCPGMAKAGSGDVLSGIITGLLAYNEDVTLSAAIGAYINGLAGEISSEEYSNYSMVASDTARSISKAISKIVKN